MQGFGAGVGLSDPLRYAFGSVKPLRTPLGAFLRLSPCPENHTQDAQNGTGWGGGGIGLT